MKINVIKFGECLLDSETRTLEVPEDFGNFIIKMLKKLEDYVDGVPTVSERMFDSYKKTYQTTTSPQYKAWKAQWSAKMAIFKPKPSK